MGGTSIQEQFSAELSRQQGQNASALSAISLPQLQDMLAGVQGDMMGGPNAIPGSVQQAYTTARTGVNADFDMQGQGTAAAISQRAKQSGQIYSDSQVTDAKLTAAQGLEQQRQGSLRQLDFSEASAGLNQFDALMNLLGAGEQTALGFGQGGAANEAASLGGLSNTSPGQGALGGGLAGAGAGAEFGPYGAVIGGVLGAAGGYFGSGG